MYVSPSRFDHSSVKGLVCIQTDGEVARDQTLLLPGTASASGGDCGGHSLGIERGHRLMKSNGAQVDKEPRCEPVGQIIQSGFPARSTEAPLRRF